MGRRPSVEVTERLKERIAFLYTYTSNSVAQIARCLDIPYGVARQHAKRIDKPEEHHTPPRTSTKRPII